HENPSFTFRNGAIDGRGNRRARGGTTAGGATTMGAATAGAESRVSRTKASSRLSRRWRMSMISPPCPLTTADTARREAASGGHPDLQDAVLRSVAVAAQLDGADEWLLAQRVHHCRLQLFDVQLDQCVGFESGGELCNVVLGDQPPGGKDADPVGGALDFAED